MLKYGLYLGYLLVLYNAKVWCLRQQGLKSNRLCAKYNCLQCFDLFLFSLCVVLTAILVLEELFFIPYLAFKLFF